MANRLVYVAGNKGNICNVVCSCTRFFVKLCPWKDVVPMNIVLQENFVPGVKVQNTAIQTRDITGQESTSVVQSSRKIFGQCY